MPVTPHTTADLIARFPELASLVAYQEASWINPDQLPCREALASPALQDSGLSPQDVDEACARLARFAPWIAEAFADTRDTAGTIESPLIEAPALQHALSLTTTPANALLGRLMIKCDHALPVSGSIKARGGIHEVLKHAETLALDSGLLSTGDNYRAFEQSALRELLSRHHILVGSTGNLGLSIGIMSARLGFCVTVHMSADARQWKKDLLRERGAQVVEHSGDYSEAVDTGRREALQHPNAYFIDDEGSRDLFNGYATAARELEQQLAAQRIHIDAQHPLCVYLPCGVGGGPGGVAYGLKLAFGDAVHCFFAEPVHSPCMLLGMLTGEHDAIAVQDIGIDNTTCADGLAVGRASAFVGRVMSPLLSGIYTLQDDTLLALLALAYDSEGLRLEPSALAGVPGMLRVLEDSPLWRAWRQHVGLDSPTIQANTTHIVWSTGGSMVPRAVWEEEYQRGKALLASRR